MRYLLVGTLSMLLACAPTDIVRSSCQTTMMATGNPYSCTVHADVVGRASSIEFDTESRNQIAKVSMAVTVTSGTMRIGYQDLTGSKQLVVTPSEPGSLEMQTRMHRDRRSFTIFFEPVNGKVGGLTGTVKYSTP
jgi:hypothetical protein